MHLLVESIHPNWFCLKSKHKRTINLQLSSNIGAFISLHFIGDIIKAVITPPNMDF